MSGWDMVGAETDKVIDGFEARGTSDLMQVLAVSALCAGIPEAFARIDSPDDIKQQAGAFVDSALIIALESRGYVVTKRGPDA